MMKYGIFLLSALFICTAILPVDVHALKIRNLDDTMHKVRLQQLGKHWNIKIPPKGVYRVSGSGIRFSVNNGEEIRTKAFEEWSIKNGASTIMRRDTRGKTN